MLSLRKPLVLVGVFFLLFLAAAVVAVGAQAIRLPTYLYHGQVRSMDEWIKLVEGGVEVHCVQLPSVEAYLSDRAVIDYACFDTYAEMRAYSETVLSPQSDQIEQAYPAPQLQRPQDSGTSILQTDHWAVYAHSGYSTLLAELWNGGSYCGQSTQIWSIAEWYSLNNIFLHHPSNCTEEGFEYLTSRWTFYPGPLSAGVA